MRRLPLLLTLLLAACGGQKSVSSLNASETRNGGYGVRIDGVVYSLDLALRGVQKSPYVSAGGGEALTASESRVLDQGLGAVVDSAVLKQVKDKLGELRQKSLSADVSLMPVDFYIANVAAYHWIKLTDLDCTDVGDDQSPFPNKVQLAYRQDKWVRFCKNFGTIDPTNQAALVLHEIIYAAHTEIATTRELVGFLFSDAFRTFDAAAQTELASINAGLSSKVRTSRQAYATEVGTVAPDTATALGAAGSTLCFGSGKTLSLAHTWLLWSVPSSDACTTGALAGPQWLALTTPSITVGGSVVGEIQPGAGEQGPALISLCSGPNTGMCGLGEDQDHNWILQSLVGQPDLYAAAKTGALARIRYLASQGANLDARDGRGKTPLNIAIDEYQPAALALLLTLGAHPNTRGPNGHLPVWDICYKLSTGNFTQRPILLTMLKSLIDAGADIVTDRLLQDAAEGDSERLQVLLTSPQAPSQATAAFVSAIFTRAFGNADMIHATGWVQMSPLGLVAAAVHTDNSGWDVDADVLDYLLTFPDIDVNTSGPFAMLMFHNHWDWVDRFLAIAGLDVNQSVTISDASTPAIFMPLRAKNYDVLQKILDRHAKIEVIETHWGNAQFNTTVMLDAIRLKDQRLVKMLVDAGADLEFFMPAASLYDRKTPLCSAAETGDEGIVRLLLSRGAKVKVDETKVYNPTCCAKAGTGIRAILEQAGGDC